MGRRPPEDVPVQDMASKLRKALWFVRRAFRVGARRTGLRKAPPSGRRVRALPGSAPDCILGQLRISLHPAEEEGGAARADSPTSFVHRHIWVRGPDYADMEDNDIRGFLDGRFDHPWNQPGQIHVRVGRNDRGPDPGEWEVLRVLQRWSGVHLLAGSRVTEARLVLEVETGWTPEQTADRPVDLYLYNVRKDWHPGSGGIHRNNLSPAATGEVWWNEVARGGRRWGLPGAGFASDTHPDADTPAMPLAVGRYRRGEPTVSFASPELNAYVQERATAGKPLLFLLKLSDYLEDAAGSLLSFYSANHGDDRNTARRPRLEVEWVPETSASRLEYNILLEHGRSLTLPRLQCRGCHTVALSFVPEATSDTPALHVRTLREGQTSNWLPLVHPREIHADWVEVRIDAVRNPVALGEPFTVTFRDTWLRTGPPETQEVTYLFRAPSGQDHRVVASYEGDFTWQVKFIPDEVGRWEYQWRQDFLPEPYHSAVGVFDVILVDTEHALQSLDRLVERIQASGLPAGKLRNRAFGTTFNRIQRALMRHQEPDGYDLVANDPGGFGARLDAAREVIGGRPPEQGPRLDPPGG
jgi:hypothetical protein